MDKIFTNHAPVPAGHYSQAVVHNGLVYVSGQLPFDPKTHQIVEGGMEAQARQVISNIEAILKATGTDLSHILKATIYIPDMTHWPELNRVYAECLGTHKPARAVVPCGDLHYGVLMEMEVIAAIP